MSATARLFGLGLRIVGGVVGWVFARPRWLFPLRLAALALALVLAANLATQPTPTSGHHATTTTTGHRGRP